LQRHTPISHSPAIPNSNDRIGIPSQRLTTSRGPDALAEEHGQVDDDLSRRLALTRCWTLPAAIPPTTPLLATAAACATALSTPSVTKGNGARRRETNHPARCGWPRRPARFVI
jgi:hypothetical protein